MAPRSPNPKTSGDPDTREILAHIRRIEIKVKRRVQTSFAGAYHSIYRGRGIEFDEFKEYTPGDDTRAIDWNVTARSTHPWVRRFKEERDLTLMVVLDASASLRFGSAGHRKSDVAAEVAAVLAFSGTRTGDRVGLIRFTDRVESFLPARKGRSQALRLIREVLYGSSQSPGTSLTEALDFLNIVQRRRTAVFLISDLMAPDFMGQLAPVARRHDLTVIRVLDSHEEKLPALGFLNFVDSESGERRLVDTTDRAFQQKFGIGAEGKGSPWVRQMKALGVDLLTLRTDGTHLDELMAHFHKRAGKRGRGKPPA